MNSDALLKSYVFIDLKSNFSQFHMALNRDIKLRIYSREIVFKKGRICGLFCL